jgi:putative DNA primase/helicase
MNDRPWPTFDRGRWITPAGIARMLKPYGIGSETIRLGEEFAKGYRLSAFEDAFARYLPSEGVTA